jgi:hypothetical protein
MSQRLLNLAGNGPQLYRIEYFRQRADYYVNNVFRFSLNMNLNAAVVVMLSDTQTRDGSLKVFLFWLFTFSN